MAQGGHSRPSKEDGNVSSGTGRIEAWARLIARLSVLCNTPVARALSQIAVLLAAYVVMQHGVNAPHVVGAIARAVLHAGGAR